MSIVADPAILTLGVLVDCSGSMNQHLNAGTHYGLSHRIGLREVLSVEAASLTAAGLRLAIWGFTEKPRGKALVIALAFGQPLERAHLERLDGPGGTLLAPALLDAGDLLLAEGKSGDARLVVITDGQPADPTPAAAAVGQLRARGLRVEAICFIANEVDTNQAIGQSMATIFGAAAVGYVGSPAVAGDLLRQMALHQMALAG